MAACVSTLSAFATRLSAISARARIARRLAWVAAQQHVVELPDYSRSALWLSAAA